MTAVVIVGAGVGGCLAALSAAENNPDADVQLLSISPGRYRYEPGTVDVLGYTAEKDGPVERPLVTMQHLVDDHPYRQVGESGVRDALGYFDELLEADSELPYRSGQTKNALVPTAFGSVRPVSRYPEAVSSGLVSDQRPMHIVGFEQLTHLDAEFVANRLDSSVPYDVEWTTVDFPAQLTESPPLEESGRALDENRETEEGTPLREAVAEVVRPELDIEPRIGFPAVLGLDDHAAVRGELESRLHAEVFEIPVGEPSLPGLRLRDRLFELVADAGIERIESTVHDFDAKNGRIQSLSLARGEDSEPTTIEGDTFVLASGGVAAGGLVGSGDEVLEPVFDCPIATPPEPREWSDADPLGDHPFARFGVDVTPTLQPTSSGEPLYENLFAAGSVLGGHNAVQERSRGGVAIVTGYEAGRQAVEEN
jgi:glycerol-3-phosphate dehydrogenase subunit B